MTIHATTMLLATFQRTAETLRAETLRAAPTPSNWQAVREELDQLRRWHVIGGQLVKRP